VTSDLKQHLTDTWASISQNVIDKAVGQWRKWLRANMKANDITWNICQHITQLALSHQQSTQENTLFRVIFVEAI